MRFKIVVLFFLSILMIQCTKKLPSPSTNVSNVDKSLLPKREMRGVWIATIENIDWPSAKGLSSDKQQQEFSEMLDFQSQLGLNAVFVQVRPASDAFYARSLEPWSEWLTGTQGKAPEPFYDPMRFMIEEAHSRNMEFHAWFNLNRGQYRNAKSIDANHITIKHPEWFIAYDGHKIYNFGLPQVREYITQLIVNVVRHYDIDGIHFDDYFYPYPVAGQVFDDNEAFKNYNRGISDLGDWRRDNVNILVKQISDAINSEKKWVKFGISPFGIWRNKSVDPQGSPTQGGQSYDELFADTRKWAKEGWIDYIAPQIYFAFEHPKVPFQPLLDWWAGTNVKCNLFVGHAIYKAGADSKDAGWSDVRQIPKQIAAVRNVEEVSGSIFYSANWLKKNKLSISDSIKTAYQYPALQPLVAWKDDVPPLKPIDVKLTFNKDGKPTISWNVTQENSSENEAKSFVIYRFDYGKTTNYKDPKNILKIFRNFGELRFTDEKAVSGKTYHYAITALDRVQNESEPSEMIQVRL